MSNDKYLPWLPNDYEELYEAMEDDGYTPDSESIAHWINTEGWSVIIGHRLSERAQALLSSYYSDVAECEDDPGILEHHQFTYEQKYLDWCMEES